MTALSKVLVLILDQYRSMPLSLNRGHRVATLEARLLPMEHTPGSQELKDRANQEGYSQ